MRRKQILDKLRLEMENSLPTNVLNSVKNQKVDKDLTPVYEEINSNGVIAINGNLNIIVATLCFSLILVSVLLIFLPLVYQILNRQPAIVSKLGIDINPSIELMLDKNDEVVFCLAKNKHAEILLNGENFVGEHANVVTEKIVKLAARAGYFSTQQTEDVENAVLISAVSEDENKQEGLINSIKGKIKNFYLSNQIYGVVLTEFTSKQELVDLICALNYNLSEEEKQDLINYSVKNLNKLLNLSYSDLKRKIGSDFIIGELQNHLNPIYEQYKQTKTAILQKLQEAEENLEKFDQVWQEKISVCEQKIAEWEEDINELKARIQTEQNPLVLLQLNIQLETKQKFLESEKQQLETLQYGSDFFNVSKTKLQNTILEHKQSLDEAEKQYLVSLESEFIKAKENLNEIESQIKDKKQDILNDYGKEFSNHLKNLIDYNVFYNSFEQWEDNQASYVNYLRNNWKNIKQNWEQNYASYLNF